MNTRIITPEDALPWPSERPLTKVFLAGTIDMGTSEDWQADIAHYIAGNVQEGVLIFNPRRTKWDSSWEQKEESPQFNFQVNWELDRIEESDIVLMNFAPGSKSPITLLELGLIAKHSPEKLLIHCPEGFWRKGNVDIVSRRERLYQVSSMFEFKNTALDWIVSNNSATQSLLDLHLSRKV